MKIIILSNSKKNSGGVERFSFYLQGCLKKSGYDVTLLAKEDLSTFQTAILKLKKLVGMEPPTLGYFLGRKALKQGFDVCIGNGLLGWNIQYRKVLNVQHGTFARGAIRSQEDSKGVRYFIKRYLWSYFETLAAKRATRCIAVSEETKESVETLYGVQNVIVIPNGIDTTLFKPMDQRASRGKLGLPQDKKIVLFASRLGAQKGTDLIATVAQQAAALTDTVFVGATFGKMSPEGYAIISLPDLPYETLAYAYAAADIFLLPSKHEGCSLALLEAMACGTPFLASPVGLVPEFKKKGMFLECIVEKQNPEAYVQGITRLLAKTPLEKEALTKELRDYIVSAHTLELFGRAYQKVIEEII